MEEEDEDEDVSLASDIRKLRLSLKEKKRTIDRISPQTPTSQFDAPRGPPSIIPGFSLGQVVTEIEAQRELIQRQREQIEAQNAQIENLQKEVTDVKKTHQKRRGIQCETPGSTTTINVTGAKDEVSAQKLVAIGQNFENPHYHMHYWFSGGLIRQVTDSPVQSSRDVSLQQPPSDISNAEQLSEASTNLVPTGAALEEVPTGAALEDQSFLDGLPLKDNLRVEETENGLRVILKIPSRTAIELHVFSGEYMSDEPDCFFLKNEIIWEVTIENIQKCVWIAVNRPGHSGEVYSYLQEIVGKYPSAVPRAPSASRETAAETRRPVPYDVKRLDLGDIHAEVLRMNTMSNIQLILLVACTDHDDLANVSAHLDKKRMGPKH